MPHNEGTQNQQAPDAGTQDPGTANSQTQDPGGSGGTQEPTKPLVYDDWIKEQPEDVKSLLEGNVTGLKSALKSERDMRTGMEGDLKDLAQMLEGDPKTKVEYILQEFTKATEKVTFYDDAQKAGISNLALAYHIAVSEQRIDGRGNVNFEAMKHDYPDLFQKVQVKPSVPSGAGQGGGAGAPNAGDPFSDAIRKAAGYGN